MGQAQGGLGRGEQDAGERKRRSFRRSSRHRSWTGPRSQAKYWTAPHVANWLELIGLKLYKQAFLDNGVSGSVLLDLSNDQFERCFGITDSNHELSLRLALVDLRGSKQIDYTKWAWCHQGVIEWLRMRGLDPLILRFEEAAVHGGVLFRLKKREFATRLGIGEDESELVLDSLWFSVERARRNGYYLNPDEDYRDWGPDEVREWLESIHLGHLEETFREHCINGTLLPHLTNEKLRRTVKLTEIQAMVVSRAIKSLVRSSRRFNSQSSKSRSSSQRSSISSLDEDLGSSSEPVPTAPPSAAQLSGATAASRTAAARATARSAGQKSAASATSSAASSATTTSTTTTLGHASRAATGASGASSSTPPGSSNSAPSVPSSGNVTSENSPSAPPFSNNYLSASASAASRLHNPWAGLTSADLASEEPATEVPVAGYNNPVDYSPAAQRTHQGQQVSSVHKYRCVPAPDLASVGVAKPVDRGDQMSLPYTIAHPAPTLIGNDGHQL